MSTLVGLFYAEDVFVLFILAEYSIFFKLIFCINTFLKKSIQPTDGTLICTASPSQSGSGGNGNGGVLHAPQRLRFGTSLLDAV